MERRRNCLSDYVSGIFNGEIGGENQMFQNQTNVFTGQFSIRGGCQIKTGMANGGFQDDANDMLTQLAERVTHDAGVVGGGE